MFSRSYALLVIESGIKRLFDNIRIHRVIEEAKTSLEQLQLLLPAQGGKKDQYPEWLISLLQDQDKLAELAKKFTEYERINSAFRAAFFGGNKPSQRGCLYRLLEQNGVDAVIEKGDVIMEVLISIAPIYNRLKSSGQPIANTNVMITKPEDLNNFLKTSATLDDFENLANFAGQLADPELAKNEIMDKLRGAEYLGKADGLHIFKFKRNGGPEVLEALKEVGELQRPEAKAKGTGGVCTRRSNPGGCLADTYLKKSTIYAGVESTGGRYIMRFQGHFASEPEIKNDINVPIQLPGEETFQMILKDIVKRVAQEKNQDPTEVYNAIMRAIGELKDAKKAAEESV